MELRSRRKSKSYQNQFAFRRSSRGLPWKLSKCAFCLGFPVQDEQKRSSVDETVRQESRSYLRAQRIACGLQLSRPPSQVLRSGVASEDSLSCPVPGSAAEGNRRCHRPEQLPVAVRQEAKSRKRTGLAGMRGVIWLILAPTPTLR